MKKLIALLIVTALFLTGSTLCNAFTQEEVEEIKQHKSLFIQNHKEDFDAVAANAAEIARIFEQTNTYKQLLAGMKGLQNGEVEESVCDLSAEEQALIKPLLKNLNETNAHIFSSMTNKEKATFEKIYQYIKKNGKLSSNPDVSDFYIKQVIHKWTEQYISLNLPEEKAAVFSSFKLFLSIRQHALKQQKWERQIVQYKQKFMEDHKPSFETTATLAKQAAQLMMASEGYKTKQQFDADNQTEQVELTPQEKQAILNVFEEMKNTFDALYSSVSDKERNWMNELLKYGIKNKTIGNMPLEEYIKFLLASFELHCIKEALSEEEFKAYDVCLQLVSSMEQPELNKPSGFMIEILREKPESLDPIFA